MAIRARMNGMPLYGKSQGVRRYVEELALALPQHGVDLDLVPSSSESGILAARKIGFALRRQL